MKKSGSKFSNRLAGFAVAILLPAAAWAQSSAVRYNPNTKALEDSVSGTFGTWTGTTVNAQTLQVSGTSIASLYQPLDSDLTAIAALTTTTFGRSFLALADAAAGRTALGLGTAATSATGDFVAATSGTAANLTLSGTLSGAIVRSGTTTGGTFSAVTFSGSNSVASGTILDLRGATNSIWAYLPASTSFRGWQWGTETEAFFGYLGDASKEMKWGSPQHIAIVPGRALQGVGQLQIGDNSANAVKVLLSRQGVSNAANPNIPGVAIVSGWAFHNGSTNVDGYSAARFISDSAGNGKLDLFLNSNNNGGVLSSTLNGGDSGYALNLGTIDLSFTVDGVDLIGEQILNLGAGGITFTSTGAADTINNLGGTAGKWTTANTTGIAASGSNSDITALTAIATSSAGAGGIAAPSGARLRFSGTGSSSSVRIDLNGSEMISMGSGGGTQFAIGSGLSLVMVNGTIAFSTAGTGITGTVLANNANAGIVGEHVSSAVASGSAVSMTTATSANVTSISLTAGDWDVAGNVNFAGSSATVTGAIAGISTTNATLPTDGTEVYSGVQTTTTTVTNGITVPRKRISIASTTTVYLVGQTTFSAGTVSAFGSITARRVR